MQIRTFLAAGLLSPIAGATAQSITSIGVLPGASSSAAVAVSHDGTIVAGSAGAAVLWSAAAGLQAVAPNWAIDLSGDGLVIVGPNYRWSQATGLEPIHQSVYDITGISFDGSVVVGQSGLNPPSYQACRWTSVGLRELGVLPGMRHSAAYDVSADGSVIVGESSYEVITDFPRPFRWDEAGGMQDLGTLPGHLHGAAVAVTPDGSMATGWSGPWSDTRLVRWTSAGPEDLGRPPGFHLAGGNDISADGSVIVGEAHRVVNELPEYRAMLWTPQTGAVDLNLFLPSIGLNLGDWFLERALGVSADGTVIVGHGLLGGQFRGFVVTIPAPPSIALLLPLLCAVPRRRT